MSRVVQPRGESNDLHEDARQRSRRENPQGREQVREMYDQLRWERYWRRVDDDYRAKARAVAAVDRMGVRRSA